MITTSISTLNKRLITASVPVSTALITKPWTSNNDPDGWLISADYDIGGAYPAWHAVDGVYSQAFTSSSTWASENNKHGILTIQAPSAKIVTKYEIYPDAEPEGTGEITSPSSWTFEGSNNGTDWTVLDTVSGVSGWVIEQSKQFDIANTTAYLYYRWNITNNNGRDTYVAVAEVQLYGY